MENKFEQMVIEKLAKIEGKIDDLKDIRDKANSADFRSCENEKDIKTLQDNNQWLWRTIIGGFVLGFIGIIILFLQRGIGIN